MRRQRFIGVAVVLFVLALGACGDDSDDGGEPSAPDTTEAATVAGHCEAAEAYAADVEAAGDQPSEAQIEEFGDGYQDLQAENRSLGSEELTEAEAEELVRCTEVVSSAYLSLPS
jgi:hypothetical protein